MMLVYVGFHPKTSKLSHFSLSVFKVPFLLVPQGLASPLQVVASMNEINKQKRLRDASQMAAEAEKIKATPVTPGWGERGGIGKGVRGGWGNQLSQLFGKLLGLEQQQMTDDDSKMGKGWGRNGS